MKSIFRLIFPLFAFVALAHAEKPVNTTFFGVAIKGYDPVAYFTDNKPMKGDAKFSHEWTGAKWHFSSAEHRELFQADPTKYAPQFGGYCAWAVSQNYTANSDPERAWKVVNGKLYLNYNREVQQKWETDVPGNIAKGDVNWPKLLKK